MSGRLLPTLGGAALLAAAGWHSSLAQQAPTAPSVLIIQTNMHWAAPSPHMLEFQWLVAEDAAGYGWEIERGYPRDGATTWQLKRLLPPGLTFPGDFANEFDDETKPGVPVCFRVRATAPERPDSDWSRQACATLGEEPPRVNMNVSARAVPNGMRVEWDAVPDVDVGYLPQATPERNDGLTAWLGSGLTAPGAGRLSAFIPASQAAGRWCVRVMPVYRGRVNLALSEERCFEKPDTASDPSTPPATPDGTPIAPSSGTGQATSGGPQSSVLVGAILAVSLLCLGAVRLTRS